jgi:ATP-binding cassette subfamily B protein
MVEILSEEPEIQDRKDAPKLKVPAGAVSFNNVVFQYSDARSTKKLLDDFNLDIPAGQKIGLVGHSGGGKTTITKLILRLMDIQGGSISIDGQNIAEITQESLRQSIAYVPQEPLLFHRTVAQNISYGMPGATQEQIEQSAKLAYAHGFIQTLPDGYNTIVGERGVKLSGGQRQRVAIARAILKDAPILVLDEATSALDSESEVLIQKALQKLMKTKTSIVIAHRLSTVQKMDHIVVVDNGKITEEGAHADLLKKDGVYAKLWAHQSGGFIE